MRLELVVVVGWNEHAVTLRQLDLGFVHIFPERVLFDVWVEEINRGRLNGFDRVGHMLKQRWILMLLEVVTDLPAGHLLPKDVRNKNDFHRTIQETHELLRCLVVRFFTNLSTLHQLYCLQLGEVGVELRLLQV